MKTTIYLSESDNEILIKYCYIQGKKKATLISDIIKAFIENREKDGNFLIDLALSQIEYSAKYCLSFNIPEHYLDSVQEIADKIMISRIHILSRILSYRCKENKLWIESKYSSLINKTT